MQLRCAHLKWRHGEVTGENLPSFIVIRLQQLSSLTRTSWRDCKSQDMSFVSFFIFLLPFFFQISLSHLVRA